ncbi:MAG: hypothetical protein ACK5AZ_08510 [Bryobacteraceae bacterium]
MSLGILVLGDNHFIGRGPLPSKDCARALARRWSLIGIGTGIDMTRPEPGSKWRVSTREFREDLEWAVVLETGAPLTEAVRTLLDELKARGVVVHRATGPFDTPGNYPSWPGEECS